MIAPPVHFIYRPASHVRHVREFDRGLTVEHFGEPHPSLGGFAKGPSISASAPTMGGAKQITGAPTLPKVPHRKIRIKHAKVKSTRSK
jgi:hypothetical protein